MATESREEIHPGRHYIDGSAFFTENPKKKKKKIYQKRDPIGRDRE